MKKVMFTISGILLLGLIILMVVASAQPDEYRVERSTYIEVEPKLAFQGVVDLKAWKNWSPWIERDPKMKMEYSEPSAGRGASVYWTSLSEGTGTQTITDVIGQQAIKLRLNFSEPFVARSKAYFHFFPENSGVKVEWIMEVTNDSLMDKVVYLLIDIPSVVAKDFEKGLANMKAYLEKSTNS